MQIQQLSLASFCFFSIPTQSRVCAVKTWVSAQGRTTAFKPNATSISSDVIASPLQINSTLLVEVWLELTDGPVPDLRLVKSGLLVSRKRQVELEDFTPVGNEENLSILVHAEGSYVGWCSR